MAHDKGEFGVIRKHDIHTGIDTYSDDKDPVYSITDGYVKDIVEFTGFKESPWWHDTYAIIVSFENVDILYGEVMPCIEIGDEVKSGQQIGNIERVLRKDKGLPTSMLHLECYYNFEKFEYWYEKEKIPHNLLNPTSIINSVYLDDFSIKDDEISIKNIESRSTNNIHGINLMCNIPYNFVTIESMHYLFNGIYTIHVDNKYILHHGELKMLSYNTDTHLLQYEIRGFDLEFL